MKTKLSIVALSLALLTVLAALLLSPVIAPTEAKAQAGPAACRCSGAITVSGTTFNLSHCQCGAMTCAVIDSQRAGAPHPVLQCTK